MELLSGLVDSSKIIGVGLTQRDDFYKYTVQRANKYDMDCLCTHMVYDMGENSDLEKSRFTSLPQMDGSPINIVAMQLPIAPDHKFWRDESFRGMIKILDADSKKRNTVISYGYLKAVPRGEYTLAPMPTTRFFPASFVPGWNFIMELVKDL